jgi:hypothetical protein
MSKEWTFIDHVTDYLTRPKMGDQKEPTFYPSEATATYLNKYGETTVVGKCRRSAFFRLVRDLTAYDPETYAHLQPLADELAEKDIPADRYMRWIWEAGNLYETHLTNLAKAAGVFIGEQITVYIPKVKVSGRIDLVIVNPRTGKLSVVEAKSIYGHNADSVFGKELKKFTRLGEPRDSNLMQIAIYDWWFASARDDFEESRLTYGARDKGTYGEFLVRINYTDPDNLYIEYKQMLPIHGEWVTTPMTINSIIRNYQYIQEHIDTNQIPPRDYDLQFTPEQLERQYQDGELTEAETKKHEKLKVVKLREDKKQGIILSEENEALLLKYDGKRIVKDQKPIEKGNWQCRLCSARNVCYDDTGNPRNL